MEEVSLGKVAGLFLRKPVENLIVSPIDLVHNRNATTNNSFKSALKTYLFNVHESD